MSAQDLEDLASHNYMSSLPPQTSMKPQDWGASKPVNNAEEQPPVVPQEQLADYIKQMQEGGRNAVPSAEPSAQDKEIAGGARGIGNAFGDAIANQQAMINILRPGAGNMQLADNARRGGEQFAQERLGGAEAKRKEAIQNLSLNEMADEKKNKQLQMVSALKQQREMGDAKSEISKQAQESALQRLDMYASATQNPELKQKIQAMTLMIPTMSAERIDKMDKNGDLVKLLGQESNERAQGAHNDIIAGNADKTNKLGWAQLSEKEKHDLAQEEKDRQKGLKAQVNEDRKTVEEIKNLQTGVDQLKPLLKQLDEGKINQGAIHNYWNEIAKKANAFGVPLKIDTKLQAMRTNLPLTQGGVEQAVTHSSRFSPHRWEEFMPKPGEGNDLTKAKLEAGMKYLQDTIEEKKGQLNTGETGEPNSQSAYAKALPPGDLPKTAQAIAAKQTPAPMMTQQAPPPRTPPEMVAKAKKALLDPGAPPAAKAAAKRILDAVGKAVQDVQ